MSVNEYLFVFGYQTPDEALASAESDIDQESLGYFRILAATEDEARRWGIELSRWYTDALFGHDGERHWNPDWFASWIEYAPTDELRESAERMPVLKIGELPSFELIAREFSDLR